MADISCDALIIGGGPGGYVCAIRAGQLGLRTVLVERSALGGTCLNVGCIPSKALIHVADEFHRMTEASGAAPTGLSCKEPSLDLAKTMHWKDGIVSRLTTGVESLLKRASVEVLRGTASFLDGKTVEVDLDGTIQRVTSKFTVIATGSQPVGLPGLPLGGKVIGSTEALCLTKVPKKLVVIGAGYIGLELGTAFAKLGSAVDIVEAGPRLLPLYDKALVAPVAKRLADLGVTMRMQTKVTGMNKAGRAILDDGTSLACNYVLVTAGRTACTEGFGLKSLDLAVEGPFLVIDERCETSMQSVFAIGDVTGEPLLAHRAMAQGELVADIMVGKKRRWDEKLIPAICFTDPEIVSVGLSPDNAQTLGIETIETPVSLRRQRPRDDA